MQRAGPGLQRRGVGVVVDGARREAGGVGVVVGVVDGEEAGGGRGARCG